MKKLYFFLVAMLVSFAANAGLYMSGSFNGWKHCNPAQEFTETSTSGVYTLSVDELSGEFLICSGTANTPNWSALRFGSNGQKVKEGVEYTAVRNGSANFNMDGTVKNATVTLNTNTNKLLVEGASEANSFEVVYLVGDINGSGWNEALTTYPLASVGNDTYEGTIDITSASFLKPRCGNQILSASGSDLVPVMGQTYTLGSGDKAVSLKVGKYDVKVVADQAAESCQITFTKEGDDPDPVIPDDPTDITIYWNNANAKWAKPTVHYWGATESTWPGVPMTKVAGTQNVWEYKLPAGTTGILFNAGDGDATKTSDFVPVNNHIYNQSGDQGVYEGEDPDPVVESLQFYGNVNGAGWELVDLTDGSHTFEVTSQTYFTFTTSGNWEKAWRPKTGADQVLTENGTVEAAATGSNGTFIIKVAGTYTVTPDADNTTFTIDGFSGEGPDPVVEKLQILIYMEGEDGASWEVKDLNEDGSYTFDSTNDIDALFTFTTTGDWDKAWHPLSNIDELIIENGTYQAIVNNGADHNNGIFKITAPGTFVVTPDEATTSFTVTGFSEEVEMPEALYLIGYVDGHDFSTLNGMKNTTAEDGVYTFEKANIGNAGEGYGYINFATVVDTEGTGDWDTTVNSGNRYGAPANDTPLTADAPADVEIYKAGVNASACASWKIKEGIYNVTVNLNTMKVSVEEVTTGIEAIEMEGGVAPVYYNLQGVRVMNPENGIFIEVRGNKAVKVVK